MAPALRAPEDVRVSAAHWVNPHLLTLLRIRAQQVCAGTVGMSRAKQHFPNEGTVMVVRCDPNQPFVVWDFHYDRDRPGTGVSFTNGEYLENASEAYTEFSRRGL